MRNFIMKKIIIVFIFSLSFYSCQKTKKEDVTVNQIKKNEFIIDIKTIFDKSEIEIEKILGTAEEVAIGKFGIAQKNTYQNNKFEITFYEGKSKNILIRNISNCDFKPENIKLVGLSPKAPSYEVTSHMMIWTDIENIGEIGFSNNGKNQIDLLFVNQYIGVN